MASSRWARSCVALSSFDADSTSERFDICNAVERLVFCLLRVSRFIVLNAEAGSSFGLGVGNPGVVGACTKTHTNHVDTHTPRRAAAALREVCAQQRARCAGGGAVKLGVCGGGCGGAPL